MNPPPFPVHLWSCYERTLAGQDRTNNFAEAAHRRIQNFFEVSHPSLGRFIQELKKIQRTYDHIYDQYLRGEPAKAKRKIYKDADKKILALVQRYAAEGDQDMDPDAEAEFVMTYLKGLAYHFIMDQ